MKKRLLVLFCFLSANSWCLEDPYVYKDKDYWKLRMSDSYEWCMPLDYQTKRMKAGRVTFLSDSEYSLSNGIVIFFGSDLSRDEDIDSALLLLSKHSFENGVAKIYTYKNSFTNVYHFISLEFDFGVIVDINVITDIPEDLLGGDLSALFPCNG